MVSGKLLQSHGEPHCLWVYCKSSIAIVHTHIYIYLYTYSIAGVLFFPWFPLHHITRTFSLKILKPDLGHDFSDQVGWLCGNLTSDSAALPASLEVRYHKPKSVLTATLETGKFLRSRTNWMGPQAVYDVQTWVHDQGIGFIPFGRSHGLRCGWLWMVWPQRNEMSLKNGRTWPSQVGI